MRDYADQIARLRECASNSHEVHSKCGAYLSGVCAKTRDIRMQDAADAIEELLAAVRSVVRCKDCEWWTKQEASIQGRCARLAIYPTGEFYCASGSKREPPKGVE